MDTINGTNLADEVRRYLEGQITAWVQAKRAGLIPPPLPRFLSSTVQQ